MRTCLRFYSRGSTQQRARGRREHEPLRTASSVAPELRADTSFVQRADAASRASARASAASSAKRANQTNTFSPLRTGRRGNVFSDGSVTNRAIGARAGGAERGLDLVRRKNARTHRRPAHRNSRSSRRCATPTRSCAPTGARAARRRAKAGIRRDRTQQQHVVGIDHRRVRRFAMRFPDRTAIERRAIPRATACRRGDRDRSALSRGGAGGRTLRRATSERGRASARSRPGQPNQPWAALLGLARPTVGWAGRGATVLTPALARRSHDGAFAARRRR